MIEIFKTVSEYTDYEVSNFGRIRTKSRLIRYTHSVTKKEHFRKTESKFLKIQYNNRTGYKFCQLYLDKKMYNVNIHRLVAKEFLTNYLDYDTVNHKDGNKHNNTVENLEWCTHQYNHEHATKTGLKAKGSKISSSKLTDNSVHAIKYFLLKGMSYLELSVAFNVSRATIYLINKNKIWKHVALTGTELEINL